MSTITPRKSLVKLFALPVMTALLTAPLLCAQEADPGAGDKPTATTKFRGRLPAYFKDVVTAQQKDKIYGIQEEYSTQIKALQRQIVSLIKDRDNKVNAVLSDAQMEEVRQLAEASRARRLRLRSVPTDEVPPAGEDTATSEDPAE